MYIIYRLEDLEGKGPYSGKISAIEKMLEKHDDNSDYPPIAFDIPVCWQRDFADKLRTDLDFDLNCAFKSKEQLLNWFTPEDIKMLIKHGYRIRRYRVNFYLDSMSDKQIFFNKSIATPLFSMPPVIS